MSHIPIYDGRIIGTHGEEADRVLTHPLRREGEFHSTTQGRAFLRDSFIGPTIYHGNVGSLESMLSLNDASALSEYSVPVGCWPGDTCKRTDTIPPSFWQCIAGHGLNAADWERRGFDDAGTALAGHWEPVHEDDELLYDGDDDEGDGDLIMDFVEESED